ncbi:MAG: bifunctional demethylmenaquinone methyltransferase/2-methoxy-6-polyprenyl-1,4-benzoquinol methylase UbiE [Bacteroidia bacterium]|nr:bifunctional demethylmenaquinone methyltransferase/2-methoxy-6-polyprenyl-1,4-benzoquinol methylase UbiE [Bacteroidia bacterium]NNJ55641.1 bifunctional demethylmenaquinone methyltransferase/2-methoxy-6-polyprenyl-1,4-benzoquinol methylase UbiE [Bacteroidia bacterium]
MGTKVKPYNSSDSKKQEVQQMFDNIAHKYDFLNRFLSLGIDKGWRKTAIKILAKHNPKKILDVATGTGDFAIATLKINPDEVIGVDISEGMLEVGKKKIADKGIQNIRLEYGDSEDLQFDDNTFDAVIVAFGVRNFENLSKGLKEINRVLRPGGIAMVLEFSKPKGLFGAIFNIYNKTLLPLWGKLFSGDNAAYTYLPESVKAFPEGNEFLEIMRDSQYNNVDDKRLTFGVCSIYTGIK